MKKICFFILCFCLLSAKKIVLTFDNSADDGFGTQYAKLLAIYCIAREYHYKYLHTPIQYMHYHGLAALEKNILSKEYVDACNKRIFIPSDVTPKDIKNHKVLQKNLPLYLLKKQKNVVVKYREPLHFIDPEIYKHAKGIYNPQIPRNKKFTLGIHVRRGDLFIYNMQNMLPNHYYIELAQKIINLCQKQKIDFVIELYTEIPKEKTIIDSSYLGIPPERKPGIQPTTIDPSQNKIEEFSVLPNLHKYISTDTWETFDRMVHCDILIGSKSSFTACASYVKKGITVYYPFWMKMMKRDIAYNDPFLEEKITSFIKNFCAEQTADNIR